jgi:hypothetical protein
MLPEAAVIRIYIYMGQFLVTPALSVNYVFVLDQFFNLAPSPLFSFNLLSGCPYFDEQKNIVLPSK